MYKLLIETGLVLSPPGIRSREHLLSGAVSVACFVQSDDDATQGPTAFVRSRLLSGLTNDNIHDAAVLAATFGPIVQIDGSDPNKRVILPLHPEILQVLLLQMLKQVEEEQVHLLH